MVNIQDEVVAYLLGLPSVFKTDDDLNSAVQQINHQLRKIMTVKGGG